MERMIFPKTYYNPQLKQLARKLRKNSTLGELLLWDILKRKQLKSCDFHRQKPIGNYIVDFYCHKLQLIIEIDGSTHDFKTSEDAKRQKYLENLGLKILRLQKKKFGINVVESLGQ